MTEVVDWLNQPTDPWWTIGLLIVLPVTPVIGTLLGFRWADRREQRRYEEWVRRFEGVR